MKVLMAADGSKLAAMAFRTAMRLLSPVDRNLDLLFVAPRFPNQGPGRENYERRASRETTRVLERTRAGLASSAGVIRLLTAAGSPAAVVVNKAEEYDLTVVGPKGRGAASDAGLGSVARRVVEHALGAVLVGRRLRSDDGIRLLIAVDGSTASMHAVETLGALFDLASAEVCLMHVAETPWIQWGVEEENWTTSSEEDQESSEAGVMEKELVREGEVAIEQARDRLRTHRISITTRIDEGNPANEILSEAERGQYDLIVLGATGTRDLKHRMLGSVSAKVAWDAPCSVLIVREPEETG
jgi:nucleotide-binding universal stress UspA family protein